MAHSEEIACTHTLRENTLGLRTARARRGRDRNSCICHRCSYALGRSRADTRVLPENKRVRMRHRHRHPFFLSSSRGRYFGHVRPSRMLQMCPCVTLNSIAKRRGFSPSAIRRRISETCSNVSFVFPVLIVSILVRRVTLWKTTVNVHLLPIWRARLEWFLSFVNAVVYLSGSIRQTRLICARVVRKQHVVTGT